MDVIKIKKELKIRRIHYSYSFQLKNAEIRCVKPKLHSKLNPKS